MTARLAAPDDLTPAERWVLAATVTRALRMAAESGARRYVVAAGDDYGIMTDRPPPGCGHYTIWPGGRMEYRAARVLPPREDQL